MEKIKDIQIIQKVKYLTLKMIIYKKHQISYVIIGA